jgi:hypothetical protein
MTASLQVTFGGPATIETLQVKHLLEGASTQHRLKQRLETPQLAISYQPLAKSRVDW